MSYSFFFEYEPLLTLGARADGVPFEGELRFSRKQRNQRERAPYEPTPPLPDSQPEIVWNFHSGRATLKPEDLTWLSQAESVSLANGPEVTFSWGDHVACAQNIFQLDARDACKVENHEVSSEACDHDSLGNAAWAAHKKAFQLRFVDCHMARLLPDALSGSSRTSREFYLKFDGIDSDEVIKATTKVRESAARRLGPAEPQKWRTLLDELRNISDSRWRFSLCDISPKRVSVWFTDTQRNNATLHAPKDKYPDKKTIARINQIVQRTVGDEFVSKMVFEPHCNPDQYWYLATPPS